MMKEYVTEDERREFAAAMQRLKAGTEQRRSELIERSHEEIESQLPVFAIDEIIPSLAAQEPVLYRSSGVRDKVLRRMGGGNWTVDAELDLHGCTLSKASEQLRKFLLYAYKRNYKVVRIIHGKGNHSGKAVLKSGVVHWLRQVPWVLAFRSAAPNDGGSGSLYVLLKRHLS